MFCPNCGAQMPEGTSFCSSCGSHIDSASDSSAMSPTGYTDPAMGATAYTPMPNNGKKRNVLIAVIAAAAVVVIAIIIALIVLSSSPTAKVTSALSKSYRQLDKILANSDNFTSVMENSQDLYNGGKYTAKFDVSMEDDYSLNVQINRDSDKLSLNGAYDDGDVDVEFNAYADKDVIIAELPGITDDAYSLPLPQLGTKLFDSDIGSLIEDNSDDEVIELLENLDIDLFADSSWNAFKKAYPEEAKALEKSLVIEKSDEEIPETDGKMTVYSVEIDMDALVDVLVANQIFSMQATMGEGIVDTDYISDYTDNLEDQYEYYADFEPVIYVGVSKGCITALHVELEVDGDDHTLTVVLEGDKNIWEDITVYADEEEVASGSIEQTNSGFEAVFEAESGDEVVIECDDKSGELTISVEDEEFTIEYEVTKKGGKLSFDIDDVSCSMELCALEKVEKIDGAVDLLTLDEDELEEIVENIAEEIDG